MARSFNLLKSISDLCFNALVPIERSIFLTTLDVGFVVIQIESKVAQNSPLFRIGSLNWRRALKNVALEGHDRGYSL